MATRTRHERELIDSQVDARIRSVAEPRPLPVDAVQRDLLLRAAVNRTAVQRLTDVSVTPQQLRRQLGLANNDDPED